MDSSSSSENDSPQPPVVTGRAVKKTFIFLTNRVSCVPRKGAYDKLAAGGRVRDITIYPSFTSQQMFDVIKSNIPATANLDPDRIRIYRSTSRGSALEKVSNSIPGGQELLRSLTGSKSNKVLLYYKRPSRRPSGGGTLPPSSNASRQSSSTPPPSSNASRQSSSTPPPSSNGGRQSNSYLSNIYHDTPAGSSGVGDLLTDEDDDNEGIPCGPREGFHGSGIKVGILTEKKKFVNEAHKAVYALDYIHSMCGGDLLFLPPGFNEACYQAMNLARPLLLIISTVMGEPLKRFVRSLNIMNNDSTILKENFPLVFYAKAGTLDGEDILSRYTGNAQCNGLDVFLCVPDPRDHMKMIIHEYGINFNGILNAITKCGELMRNYRALRNQQSRGRRDVIPVDSDEEDQEVQFGGFAPSTSTADDSTLIEDDESQQENERKEKEKRDREEKEKRDREEKEKRDREEQEKRDREEQERRDREEQEKRDREEQEKRDREEQEKRDREEKEKRDREEKEKRDREEKEKRDREEKEKRDREEKGKKDREEQERMERKKEKNLKRRMKEKQMKRVKRLKLL